MYGEEYKITMISLLNNIRAPEYQNSIKKQLCSSISIMLLGIILGTFSKYLDCTAFNELPYLIEVLDVRNFLGRFSIWILLAICISVYSKTPIRASINTFVFFVGMVTSYYLYTKYIAGFFPRSYVLIWVGFTIISPVLAFICWYAKGNGIINFAISAGIIAVLFNLAFAYGMFYFDISYPLEVVVLMSGIAVLYRSPKQTMALVGCAIIIAILLKITVLF